jgi:hypothetical protein
MKSAAAAMILAASLAAPATAHADCGDPGQDPCTGPVPTVDQVVALLSEMTDPNTPAASKNDVVTPDFSPKQTGWLDDHLNQYNAKGNLPFSYVVTDIQPAPANFAGATVTAQANGHPTSRPGWCWGNHVGDRIRHCRLSPPRCGSRCRRLPPADRSMRQRSTR